MTYLDLIIVLIICSQKNDKTLHSYAPHNSVYGTTESFLFGKRDKCNKLKISMCISSDIKKYEYNLKVMRNKYIWSTVQENYQKYEPNCLPEHVSKNIRTDLKSK